MRKIWVSGAAVAALLALASGAEAAVMVYGNDFDGGETFAAGVGGGLAGAGATAGVGGMPAPFSGDLWRNDSLGSATTLTLTDLPAHSAVDVEFLLAFIDSWDSSDGRAGPDWFNVSIDGVEVFQATANNAAGSELYGGSMIGSQTNYGFNLSWPEALFDMGPEGALSVAHSDSTLTVSMWADGAGWQGGLDESWGIDNLAVWISAEDTGPGPTPVPEPASAALFGLGLLGLMARRRR